MSAGEKGFVTIKNIDVKDNEQLVTPNEDPNINIKGTQYLVREQDYSNSIFLSQTSKNYDNSNACFISGGDEDVSRLSTGDGTYSNSEVGSLLINGNLSPNSDNEESDDELLTKDVISADFNWFKLLLNEIEATNNCNRVQLLNILSPLEKWRKCFSTN